LPNKKVISKQQMEKMHNSVYKYKTQYAYENK